MRKKMDDMMEELIDRFGDIPKKVQQLLHNRGTQRDWPTRLM